MPKPIERHNGLDKEIFNKRRAVYETAKNRHPERWTKYIRNWSLEDKLHMCLRGIETQAARLVVKGNKKVCGVKQSIFIFMRNIIYNF